MNTTKLALFEKQLTNMEDALTKSDQKIVAYLKEHPDRFTRMSITDISEDIGTSIAAITRFVKKMGYDKLQDLKLAITRDMEASESSQYVRVEEDDDILTVSKKVLQTSRRLRISAKLFARMIWKKHFKSFGMQEESSSQVLAVLPALHRMLTINSCVSA